MDFSKIFSPFIKAALIIFFLAITATYDLEVDKMDVKTTFLHSDLEEEIYMLQTEGFKVVRKENIVCRLKKLLYDLEIVINDVVSKV